MWNWFSALFRLKGITGSISSGKGAKVCSGKAFTYDLQPHTFRRQKFSDQAYGYKTQESFWLMSHEHLFLVHIAERPLQGCGSCAPPVSSSCASGRRRSAYLERALLTAAGTARVLGKGAHSFQSLGSNTALVTWIHIYKANMSHCQNWILWHRNVSSSSEEWRINSGQQQCNPAE